MDKPWNSYNRILLSNKKLGKDIHKNMHESQMHVASERRQIQKATHFMTFL